MDSRPKKVPASVCVEKLVLFNAISGTVEMALNAHKDGYIHREKLTDFVFYPMKVPSETHKALFQCIHRNLQERLEEYVELCNKLNTSEDAALELARRAFKENLIPNSVWIKLNSLHPMVPIPMRLRYLVLNIRAHINKILIKYATIAPYELDSLSDCLQFAKKVKPGLITQKMLDYLTSMPEEVKPFSFYLSQRKLKKAMKKYTVSFVNSKDNFLAFLNYSSAKTCCLGPEHLPELNSLLVSYAHRWRNIGISMRFKPQILDNIQTCSIHLISGSPQSFLTKLLQEWLERKHKYTLIPTIENLKKVLNSSTVNLGILANTLEDLTLQTAVQPLKLPYSWIPVLDVDEQPQPVYDHIFLKEGESTLLEIQIPPGSKKSNTYQWLKNGAKYKQDVPERIMCIHEAGIDLDGSEFSCQIPNLVTTVPITVHISCPLDKYRDSLASMYTAQPEMPEEIWPPIGSKKYINLALINHYARVTYDLFTKQTIQGSIDDILKHKEIIQYEDMYKCLESGKLILIEGRPGCGKTTLVTKITRDWAHQTSGYGAIRILLLLSLRVLNTIRRPNLSTLLKLFSDLKANGKLLEQCDGLGVCFIFDGLDEFSPQDGEDSIVYKIIKRKFLHRSTVVVASRPAAISGLRPRADKIIEVVGFLKHQVLEYFDYYPFSSCEKSSCAKSIELKAHLSKHPNVLQMCYLPIHAVMVAYLFMVTGKVPQTETEMYTHFTRSTIIRSISRSKKTKPSDINLRNLKDTENEQFMKICQLAFKKTVLNRQVLYQDEVNFFLESPQNVDISLGLITIDQVAHLYGFKNIYTFLHLTFQEYLAAFHLSTLTRKEQLQVLKKHGGKNHMLVVWKFFCGLAEIDEETIKVILSNNKGNFHNNLLCAYESQKDTVCAELLKSMEYSVEITNYNNFLTSDYTAIGFVINASKKPAKLSLKNVVIDNEVVNAILSGIRRNKQELCLYIISDWTPLTTCLRKLISTIPLRELVIQAPATQDFSPTNIRFTSPTKLSISNIKKLLHIRKVPFYSLKVLCLKGSITEYSEVEELADGLKYAKHLCDLDVSDNDISDEGAQLLSNGLRSCKGLEKIDISGNKISSTGMLAIFSSIQDCFLKVKEAEITNPNVSNKELVQVLQNCRNLQLLEITLKGEAVDSFCTSSIAWKVLKELRLCLDPGNDIVSTKAISSCLECFKKLEVFEIINAIYNEESAECLIAGLTKCSNLQVLILTDNQISNDEASILRSCFRETPSFSLQALPLKLQRSRLPKLKDLYIHLRITRSNYRQIKLSLPQCCTIHDHASFIPNEPLFDKPVKPKKTESKAWMKILFIAAVILFVSFLIALYYY